MASSLYARLSGQYLPLSAKDIAKTNTTQQYVFEQPLFKTSRIKLSDFSNLMQLMTDGILDTNGLPSQSLLALSNYLGLPVSSNLAELIIAWDKKFFIRDSVTNKPIERWDLERLGLGQELEFLRPEILLLIKNTGLLKARQAKYKQYDTLIIHGARLEDIEPRLKFIAQFWQQGGRFARIIFLTGERLLTNDEIAPSGWSFLPAQCNANKNISTEIALMKYAWQTNNIVPQEILHLPAIWINTPNFRDNNGVLTRGTTEDTIDSWLDSDFSSNFYWGNCLAVTNTPLILRQHVVFERKLYKREPHFTVETVGLGEKEEGNKKIIYYLREIAALLWELNQLSICATSSNGRNKLSNLSTPRLVDF